ncbi:GGDEF domain-containing protein [Butyrivibrio proteoclasticus B316]|uniref:GGDEF domain-containing protein n=1 Tax=Butyrivibrio proteoclasticus (strain ATCC 51982 / DSM 14932 / B316) TaxID=515622 RepID=E0S2R7_BUTPB|nr:sensor domain-containing diguanylate cyclase [Butyrivibrio proteoclasticus]ADL35699.1 GGDEF domain-containing protein [Butyrivibrio proteoclasticus B316]
MIRRIDNTIFSENSAFDDDHDEVLKTLYGLYDHVNLLDLNTLTLRRLYTGKGDYLFSDYTSMPDYVERISRDFIHPDDIEGYMEFCSVKNIRKQLESDGKSFTMSYFRTKGTDGTYTWKAYIILKPSFADPGIYLSCLRDVDSETEHILIKNDYVKLFNDLPLAYAVLQFNTELEDDNEIICLYASNRIAKLMDESLNHIVGSNVYPEFGKDHEDVVQMMRNAAFKGINSKTIYHSRKTGKWINITVDKAAVTGRCALILEDVTKEHITNEFMDREWRTDDLIIGCTKVLHSGLPHEVAINQVIRLVGEASGADRIYIVEKTDNNTFIGNYEWCSDNVTPIIQKSAQPEEICALDWEKEYPGAFSLVLEDVESIKVAHPELYSKLQKFEVRSIIEIPIYDEGVLIGYFGGVNYGRIKNLDLKELMEAVSYFLASEFSRLRLLRELENKSIYDSLCGVKNRSAMEMTIKKLKKRSFNIGIIYADANGLKQMNDSRGHEAGDELLKKISTIMKRRVNRDYIYRVGGDEFVIAIPKMEKQDFIDLCASLQKDFEEAEGISVAMGWDWGTSSAEISTIMKSADKLMYEDKANYYRKNNRRRSGDR